MNISAFIVILRSSPIQINFLQNSFLLAYEVIMLLKFLSSELIDFVYNSNLSWYCFVHNHASSCLLQNVELRDSVAKWVERYVETQVVLGSIRRVRKIWSNIYGSNGGIFFLSTKNWYFENTLQLTYTFC